MMETPAVDNYILAIDDTPDNLLLVELALEQEGHRVVSVDNGKAGLQQIEKSPPDLVVLDIMMPGMDGYEVTRRIRKNPSLPFIPILTITAHEETSLVKALDSGADEFIRKPVKVDELQARVRSLLRLKHSIDQRENFVRCLTHDLRTPIIAANRMLELIGRNSFGPVGDGVRKAINSTVTSNNNLLGMLNNLLDVYCYDVGQKALSFIRVDLGELLSEVVAELRPLAEEKQIPLTLTLPDAANSGALSFQGDRLELRRVFVNLVGNAIKFTDTGSVAVAIEPQRDRLQIEIRDTGIGMSDEDKKLIFQPFRQGNHKRSGHGLGLHLCQQIVSAHRGKLRVSSEVGSGSTFFVTLPRDSA